MFNLRHFRINLGYLQEIDVLPSGIDVNFGDMRERGTVQIDDQNMTLTHTDLPQD